MIKNVFQLHRLLWHRGSWLPLSDVNTVVFDTMLSAASAGSQSQPSGPRSHCSPARQAPRSIASPIVELAET